MASSSSSPTAQQVGERILMLQRELCGDNQSELARRVGLHQRDINRYVNGSNIPSAEHLAAIAQACNVSVDWLLCLTNVRQGHPEPGSVLVDDALVRLALEGKDLTKHADRTITLKIQPTMRIVPAAEAAALEQQLLEKRGKRSGRRKPRGPAR